MVRKAIEQRAGETLRTEHRRPFIEWQIAGHQRGATFIALAEDLEEQLRTNCRERHVAQLVDQQFDGVEMFLQRPQAALVARFHEFVHEGGGRGEGDTEALLACGEPKGERDVGLAGSGWTERDAVLSLLEPFAPRQLQNQRLVERGCAAKSNVSRLLICEKRARRMRRSTLRRSRSMRSSSHRRSK